MTDARRKRAKIRAWRRGMKEVDLLLGPFADQPDIPDPLFDDFEKMLEEVDRDIYEWFTGKSPVPNQYSLVVNAIRNFHKM